MSHLFESGFFGGNEAAWHGLGRVIPEDVLTSEDAIRYAELDWEVLEVPVEAVIPGILTGVPTRVAVPDFKATVRGSDNSPLGVVGVGYTPIQNTEAFAFGDDLVDSGAAKWHTAGSLREGRQVWMLMKRPEDIIIGGMEDERIARFLALVNYHDGRGAFTVFDTSVRIVCNNTLSIALRGAQRQWKARHTVGIKGRVAEARRTLELTFRYDKALEAFGNELINRPMSEREYHRFIEELLPYSPDVEDALRVGKDGGRSQTITDNARDSVKTIYFHEDNLNNVRGTQWAAFQSVAQFDDHERTIALRGGVSETERRFLRQVEPSKIKQRAVAILAPEFSAVAGQNLEIGREVEEEVVA
jgi:phage/plasmid-like protein (TIGR03299 family)